MKLPSGRVPLVSPEFDDLLVIVHQFHDASLGCACFDQHGPMAFIDTMWFGAELGYNPRPIIGGLFWFDLTDLKQVNNLYPQYDRGIGGVSINKQAGSIEFQFQDEPYEKLEFNFGHRSNFQFISSSSLGGETLERR